jgi:hypothetical protein
MRSVRTPLASAAYVSADEGIKGDAIGGRVTANDCGDYLGLPGLLIPVIATPRNKMPVK